MSATTKISLSKALKIKNRLAGRMARVKASVTGYNSQRATAEQVSVRPLYELYVRLEETMVALKAAIHKGNTAIAGDIAHLQELRGRVEWLRTMDTTNGPKSEYQTGGYHDVEYKADFKASEVAGMVGQCETQIDQLQDRIDHHNATTGVDVPSVLFEPGFLSDVSANQSK